MIAYLFTHFIVVHLNHHWSSQGSVTSESQKLHLEDKSDTPSNSMERLLKSKSMGMATRKFPQSTVKTIIKKWKENGAGIKLATAGCPQRLSNRARGGVVREATKTAVTPLKELQVSAAEMGETEHSATVAQVLHKSKLYGREMTKRNKLICSQIEFDFRPQF